MVTASRCSSVNLRQQTHHRLLTVTAFQSFFYSEGYYLIRDVPGLADQFRLSGTAALYRGDYAMFSTLIEPDDSILVDSQTYSSQNIQITPDGYR